MIGVENLEAAPAAVLAGSHSPAVRAQRWQSTGKLRRERDMKRVPPWATNRPPRCPRAPARATSGSVRLGSRDKDAGDAAVDPGVGGQPGSSSPPDPGLPPAGRERGRIIALLGERPAVSIRRDSCDAAPSAPLACIRRRGNRRLRHRCSAGIEDGRFAESAPSAARPGGSGRRTGIGNVEGVELERVPVPELTSAVVLLPPAQMAKDAASSAGKRNGFGAFTMILLVSGRTPRPTCAHGVIGHDFSFRDALGWPAWCRPAWCNWQMA